MEEEKVSEELKLANGVVSSSDGLLTFESRYSYSDMCSCDHIYIISTVTDGQSCLLRITSTHHANNLCLLHGADTASEDHICTFTEVNEFFNKVIIRLNCC